MSGNTILNLTFRKVRYYHAKKHIRALQSIVHFLYFFLFVNVLYPHYRAKITSGKHLCKKCFPTNKWRPLYIRVHYALLLPSLKTVKLSRDSLELPLSSDDGIFCRKSGWCAVSTLLSMNSFSSFNLIC